MRKFISFIAALLLLAVAANGQTVQKSKTFENIYVTVAGGGISTGEFIDLPAPFFWGGVKGVVHSNRPVASLEIGKYITPSIGFSVEGVGTINTTMSSTIVDESVVFGNGKLNFSNWLGGYKGQPRILEVVGVLGAGWGRDYVGKNQTYTSNLNPGDAEVVYGNYNTPTDKNYVVYRAGAEFNFNLGKARAWQVNIRPGMMWFNKYNGHYQSLPTFKHDARAYAQLGLTYKFGSKSKNSHNFVLCPYSRTENEYQTLKHKYNDLLNREPEVREVTKEVVKTETVTEEVPAYIGGKTYITFGIGSVALTPVERAKVEEFAKNITPEMKVNIIGSADSKTGSETRNFVLAQRRAEVVKNVLVNDYSVNADSISISTKIDVVDNIDLARSAVCGLEIVDAD